MNRKYSGFTLVEMLIVMGIIIILMAVGITAGRFAINRANDVAHADAADKLFIAVQSYLTDEREYPDETVMTSWAIATQAGGILEDYLSEAEFEGGTDATFYYWTDTKSAIVCVSKGGFNDATDRGYYCTGNGFGTTDAPADVDEKDIPEEGVTPPSGYPGGVQNSGAWTIVQDWSNDDGWVAPV